CRTRTSATDPSWFHNPPSRWPGSAESRENLGPVNIHATPEWGYETGSVFPHQLGHRLLPRLVLILRPASGPMAPGWQNAGAGGGRPVDPLPHPPRDRGVHPRQETEVRLPRLLLFITPFDNMACDGINPDDLVVLDLLLGHGEVDELRRHVDLVVAEADPAPVLAGPKGALVDGPHRRDLERALLPRFQGCDHFILRKWRGEARLVESCRDALPVRILHLNVEVSVDATREPRLHFDRGGRVVADDDPQEVVR